MGIEYSDYGFSGARAYPSNPKRFAGDPGDAAIEEERRRREAEAKANAMATAPADVAQAGARQAAAQVQSRLGDVPVSLPTPTAEPYAGPARPLTQQNRYGRIEAATGDGPLRIELPTLPPPAPDFIGPASEVKWQPANVPGFAPVITPESARPLAAPAPQAPAPAAPSGMEISNGPFVPQRMSGGYGEGAAGGGAMVAAPALGSAPAQSPLSQAAERLRNVVAAGVKLTPALALQYSGGQFKPDEILVEVGRQIRDEKRADKQAEMELKRGSRQVPVLGTAQSAGIAPGGAEMGGQPVQTMDRSLLAQQRQQDADAARIKREERTISNQEWNNERTRLKDMVDIAQREINELQQVPEQQRTPADMAAAQSKLAAANAALSAFVSKQPMAPAPSPEQVAAGKAVTKASPSARALTMVSNEASKAADEMLASNYGPLYKDVREEDSLSGELVWKRQSVDAKAIKRPEFNYKRAIGDVADMLDHDNADINQQAAKQLVYRFMLKNQADPLIKAQLEQFREDGKHKGMVAEDRPSATAEAGGKAPMTQAEAKSPRPVVVPGVTVGETGPTFAGPKPPSGLPAPALRPPTPKQPGAIISETDFAKYLEAYGNDPVKATQAAEAATWKVPS